MKTINIEILDSRLLSILSRKPEDAVEPTDIAIRNADLILKSTSHKPDRVCYLYDGGIDIVYSNNKIFMYLEFYNDGDVGYITTDWKSGVPLDNRDINLDEATSVISDFMLKS